MAWTLATTKDAKIRDSVQAVKFAQRACELTDYKQPGVLDTLAAAYASADNFPPALETAQKAIKLASSTDKKELAQQIQDRLNLYKANQSYHEP